MSIWKGGAKKTKRAAPPAPTLREVLPTEAASVLPDVVAGLSLGSPTIGLRTRSSTASATNGYSTLFAEIPEPELEKRREPRPRGLHSHHIPQSLGAASTACFVPRQSYELSAQVPIQESCSKREELYSTWTEQASPIAPPAEFSQQAATSLLFYQESQYAVNASQQVIQDVRIRSISSDPHGYRNSRNKEQRTRCSSATRSRQPRFKPKGSIAEDAVPLQNDINYSNSGPEPTSPSNSRVFATIDYQETTAQPQAVSGPSRRKTKQAHDKFPQARQVLDESVNGLTQQQPIMNQQTNSYGYQIPDLEALLSEATPNRPANLPMVLASPSRLHNMRRTQENQPGPIRPFLPLGIIVNAVFKTRDWLYIRTAHGAEGYVPFKVCLPLGILPQNRNIRGSGTAPVNPTNTASPWELRGNEGVSAPCPAAKRNPSSSNDPISTLHRGRHRERRRVLNDGSNQTDMQKLQPESAGAVADSQVSSEQRLNMPSTSRSYTIPYLV